MSFLNREEAGRRLAESFRGVLLHQPIVLALLRGGLPVAIQVAEALSCPLDFLIVRKIGTPDNPEYGIGAVTEGGHRWINFHAARAAGIGAQELEHLATVQEAELKRRVMKYRAHREVPTLRGRDVILVDDGLATGVTAMAAVNAVQARGAKKVIVAIPVCSRESASLLREVADQVICLEAPEHFYSVGSWYESFEQLSDEDVLRALESGASCAA